MRELGDGLTDEQKTARLLEAMRESITPVDFDGLVAQRVLRRISGRQYAVLRPDKVPPHVMRHVESVTIKKNNDGSSAAIYRFRRMPTERQQREIRALLRQHGFE